MDNKGPLAGGVVAGALLLLLLLLVGRLAPGEAILQLESSSASVRFLSSATAGAAATVLALMLTVLSLSYDPETRFRRVHYERIRRISRYCTVTLVLAVFLLLVFVIPFRESSPVPQAIFTGIYYLVLVGSSVLGGLMVAIMLMLYQAITGLIDFFEPGGENWLAAERDGSGGNGADRARDAPGEDDDGAGS